MAITYVRTTGQTSSNQCECEAVHTDIKVPVCLKLCLKASNKILKVSPKMNTKPMKGQQERVCCVPRFNTS